MRALLGDEADALEASLERPPARGLRVNTLKLAPTEFESLSPWALTSVPWCGTGYTIAPAERPGLHAYHAAGLYYLQEPSAMAAAEALRPQPGELAIDLAAAPGGKSTHLAALLGGDGLLVANDVHGGRARELSRNLERWGARRALVTSAEPHRLAQAWGARFDAVLLDAPCSGEGMFRRQGASREQWTLEGVPACAARQRQLLTAAASLVRPGGRLVYSTCTFEPEENEAVVASFLQQRPDFQLERLELPGTDRGVPGWAGAYERPELAGTVRIWPHRAEGEGHFVALLWRAGDARDSARARAGKRPAARGSARRSRSKTPLNDGGAEAAAWYGFARQSLLRDPFPEHRVAVFRDGVHALPPHAPDTDGISVLRPGLWLGRVERSRFTPSHSLALALASHDVAMSVDLDPEGPEVGAYLAGAELEREGADGWLLVTVSGFPLGWGKRARGIVKNHYPKGLRRPS